VRDWSPGDGGQAVDVVERLPEVREHGVGVGLADDDRAGVAQARDDRRITRCDVAGERRVAPCRRERCDVDGLLDGERQVQ
jgi:hypothetical protein